MPRARITIRLKSTVLDPEGNVVRDALHSLGYAGVEAAHMGRFVELDLQPGAGAAEVDEMCRRLLANPVTEQYHVEMVEGDE